MIEFENPTGIRIDQLAEGDSYWENRLRSLMREECSSISVHLAVFIEPYLTYILNGQKTIESRFSSRRFAPYQRIRSGDIIFLKQSGGPITGLCEVDDAWFYQLDDNAWNIIKREFATALCAQDPEFWNARKSASYATLIRVFNVISIRPVFIEKRDRRGWVLLQERCIQPSLIEWNLLVR